LGSKDHNTSVDIIIATMNANKFVERIVASVKAGSLYPGLAAAAAALGLGWYDDNFANPAVELS
jgi:hypothetical protein